MKKLPALPKQLTVHLSDLSPSTASQYSRRLARFYQHTGCKLSAITRKAVYDYLVYLARDRHVSASYQNTCLSALRWAVRVTGQRADLTGLTARRSERVPSIISRVAARDIIFKLNGQTKDVIKLVYLSGLSLSEALGVTCDSINGNQIIVNSRFVYIPEEIGDRLSAYATLAGSSGRLFTVNQNTVTQSLKRAVQAAGITQTVGTRELRNSFAARLFEVGCTIMEIKEVMGYKRLGTLLKIQDQIKTRSV